VVNCISARTASMGPSTSSTLSLKRSPKTVETRELRTDLVYRLRVIVDNDDGMLRQGMPVTVTVDLRPQK